ncbi:SUN domain-containing protein 2 isoform X2 [Macrotis lagotis]|uniref:SUN domain-containing protein 2 isoform X2 n=1 Tax=Macrotis lagotis TaxID=92651 RepID=UPI003D69CBEF
MSRRSQRLMRYSQSDEDGGSSSGGGNALMDSQNSVFKDSPVRILRKKSSSVKRTSPAHHLSSASKPQTTYYSESVVSESYVRRPRATSMAKSALLDSNSYCSGDPLERKQKGTGATESSQINGRGKRKKTIYDIHGSSSGYSSEDDYAGLAGMGQPGTAFALRNTASQICAALWTAITFPGWLFGVFYWWLGTSWYRLTTAASLLDVFVLTRLFSFLKKLLLFLLMLFLLTSLAYGAWYFYPYGLQTFHPAVLSFGASKDSNRREEVWESGETAPYVQIEQHVLSKVHALEQRLETLASEYSVQRQKEATGLEHLELKGGAGGSGLKDEIRQDMATHLQEELGTLRTEYQQGLDNLQKTMIRASQEMENWVKSEGQRLAQEAFQESRLKDLGSLEAQLTGLRQELASMSQRQAMVAEQVDLWPQKMEALHKDMESQLPNWIRKFLLQEKDIWVQFLQREDVQTHIRSLEHSILSHMTEVQGKSAKEAAASLRMTLRREGMTGVTEEEVQQIVQQALKRYSEDRIGLVDFALESSGGSVINTRCSESYITKTALLSLFGIPLWYYTQSPRVIIQPNVYPGNCWAFEGAQGSAVIRLSTHIVLSAVTLEHIPKALSPVENIPSAPKDFAILGLDENPLSEGVLLGMFTYQRDGEPIQTFHFEPNSNHTYHVIELRILSNWGHPEYTCIYRFRAHGVPAF